MAGENWRASKWIYAISGISASVYQIKEAITKMLKITEMTLLVGATIHKQTLPPTANGEYVQANCLSLKSTKDIPENCQNYLPLTKQRSDEWFNARKALPQAAVCIMP